MVWRIAKWAALTALLMALVSLFAWLLGGGTLAVLIACAALLWLVGFGGKPANGRLDRDTPPGA